MLARRQIRCTELQASLLLRVRRESHPLRALYSPNCAARYETIVWRSSGVAWAPRLTMLATIPFHSVFCRFDATTRSRSWQVTQRASTRSFPAPAGSAASAAGAAPAAGGEVG